MHMEKSNANIVISDMYGDKWCCAYSDMNIQTYGDTMVSDTYMEICDIWLELGYINMVPMCGG